MPGPLALVLTATQIKELEQARDKHPLPYVRERAAALLKIAAGNSGRAVARSGLLKQRWPDTVYDWVRRYKAEGFKGLLIRPGRGRKPAFSPSASGRQRRARRPTAYRAPRSPAVPRESPTLDLGDPEAGL